MAELSRRDVLVILACTAGIDVPSNNYAVPSTMRRRYRFSLAGLDLSGLVLAGLDLSGGDFRGANLAGASLDDADCEGADFQGANLTGAFLGDANLTGANFQRATLVLATLDGATVESACFGEADLDDGGRNDLIDNDVDWKTIDAIGGIPDSVNVGIVRGRGRRIVQHVQPGQQERADESPANPSGKTE